MYLLFLVKGLIVGIVLAVPVGPVGVLCVRRAIFEGSFIGFLSGLGAAFADTIFGIIAGFGLTFVSDWLMGYQGLLRLAGGAFLLVIGVKSLLARTMPSPRTDRRAEDYLSIFFSTFALTITNPVTILAFVGIFSAMGFGGEEATLARAAVLVSGVTLGSLAWWVGLSLGAGLFRKSLREVHLLWLNRASGVILAGSGGILLGSALLDRFG